jgi:hypothetical protein
MKKILFLSVGVAAFLVQSVSAQTLFTTANDYGQQ